MCCFSRPVKHVSKTQILAAGAGDARQALIYSMDFAASEDLAMILPLPVPPRPPDDAVRFVDLSGYADLFADLRRAFPEVVLVARGPAPANLAPRQTLKVHAVGDFEASFVPTVGDFERLDERFRLAPGLWEKLPQYRDHGLAVFKLRGAGGLFGRLRAETKTIHPMAFVFPRRDPDQLFFPTVHIHDGEVHPQATFDHTLYCQTGSARSPGRMWVPSDGPIGRHIQAARVGGLVNGDAPAFRLTMLGALPNRDTLIPARP